MQMRRSHTEFNRRQRAGLCPKELYGRLLSPGIGRTDSVWPDLGTGTGVVSRGLAGQGAIIIGADISNELIEQAVIRGLL